MLSEKEQLSSIYKSAIKMLSFREHCRYELGFKLINKNHAKELVEQVLDVLEERKYLNDFRYVEAFCASRIRKGYGEKKIRFELSQKQIKGSMLDDVLFSIDESLWIDTIKKQISKKVISTNLTFPDKMKLFRSLSSRGFHSNQIQTAFEDFINAE